MKRIILTFIMVAFLLAGCGGGGKSVAYRPASFGENGHCYYVSDPGEAQELLRTGLCPSNWVPYPITPQWHSMYYPWYSSPSYINAYVPAPNRSNYVSSEKNWGSINKRAIAAESQRATYKGSNGKTVSADKIGASKYGGGARFGPVGTKFGGGSARTGDSPSNVKAPSSPSKSHNVKAPSSPSKPSSGGSKSYGGGSGRSSGGYSGGGSKSYGGGGGRR